MGKVQNIYCKNKKGQALAMLQIYRVWGEMRRERRRARRKTREKVREQNAIWLSRHRSR